MAYLNPRPPTRLPAFRVAIRARASGRARLAIIALAVICIAAGVTLRFVLFRGDAPDPGSPPAGDCDTAPVSADMSRPSVLIESFEWQAGETSNWGGGITERDHATEGEQGYRVVYSPDRSGGAYCRQASIPRDFTRHRQLLVDAISLDGPLPISVILAHRAERGRTFVFEDLFVFPWISTLELDLDLVPADLRGCVGSVQLACGVEPDRDLEVVFDNLRLVMAGEPVLPGDPLAPPLAALFAGRQFIPDAGFDRGLGLWRVEPLPGGRWTVAIVRGERAYGGGPSLGVFGLQRGGVRIATPDLTLFPGPYLLRMALRADPEVRWELEWRAYRGGEVSEFGELGRERLPATTPGRDWEVVEREVSIPREPGQERGEARRVRMGLIVSGVGDLFLDAVELESLEGLVPGAEDRLALDPPAVAGGGDGMVPRWRWDGSTLGDEARGAVFPVLGVETAFPLTAWSRKVRGRLRALGVQAAIDLGGASHADDLGLLREQPGQYGGDPRVGAWLLARAADWDLHHLSPAFVRRGTEVLATDDARLVLLGLRGGRPVETTRSFLERFLDTADAIVIPTGLENALDEPSVATFAEGLEVAREVCRDRSPFLAAVRLGPYLEALRLQFYLARILDAAGIVLEPPSRGNQGVDPEPMWSFLERLLDENHRLTRRLEGATDIQVTPSSPRVRARALRASEGVVILVASLSSEPLSGVRIETESGSRSIDLDPWEARVTLLENE